MGCRPHVKHAFCFPLWHITWGLKGFFFLLETGGKVEHACGLILFRKCVQFIGWRGSGFMSFFSGKAVARCSQMSEKSGMNVSIDQEFQRKKCPSKQVDKAPQRLKSVFVCVCDLSMCVSAQRNSGFLQLVHRTTIVERRPLAFSRLAGIVGFGTIRIMGRHARIAWKLCRTVLMSFMIL